MHINCPYCQDPIQIVGDQPAAAVPGLSVVVALSLVLGTAVLACVAIEPVCCADEDSVQETGSLQGHTVGVRSVAFSPDANRIASGGYDGTVKLWDVRPIGREKK